MKVERRKKKLRQRAAAPIALWGAGGVESGSGWVVVASNGASVRCGAAAVPCRRGIPRPESNRRDRGGWAVSRRSLRVCVCVFITKGMVRASAWRRVTQSCPTGKTKHNIAQGCVITRGGSDEKAAYAPRASRLVALGGERQEEVAKGEEVVDC